MGDGHKWTAALELCASYGIGMSLVMIALSVVLYWKRRRIGVLLTTVALLTLGFLGGSSWLVYRGSLSPARAALDRVDHQILYMVDRERRIRFLVDRRYEPVEIPVERLGEALDLAQGYLAELQHSAVDVGDDLEFLRERFQVGVTPTLDDVNYRKGRPIISQYEATVAAGTLFLAAFYLASRAWSPPKKTAAIGWFGTAAVFLWFLFLLPHAKSLYALAMLGIVALVLNLSCLRKSARLLELAAGSILVLAAGLFVLAARGCDFYGENDIRRKVTAMDWRLPRIQSSAHFLGESLAPLAESKDRPSGFENAVSEIWHLSYDLFISLGGLETDLGNTNEGAGIGEDYRKFDPYQEDFDLFRQDPFQEGRFRDRDSSS